MAEVHRCKKCNSEKVAGDFYKRSSGRVSTECKVCHSARMKANYAKNSEAVKKRVNANYWANVEANRAVARTRYAANPEPMKAYQVAYRIANPEAIKARNKSYYVRNKSACAARSRNWIETNRDWYREWKRAWSREWRSKNRLAHCAKQRKRAAAIRASQRATLSEDALNARMHAWGYVCVYCGGPFEALEHLKSISRGGPHILSNIAPVCTRCNSALGARDEKKLQIRMSRKVVALPLP